MARPAGARTVRCVCLHPKSKHRDTVGCRGLAVLPGHEVVTEGGDLLMESSSVQEVLAPCQCGLTPAAVRDLVLGRPLEQFKPIVRRRAQRGSPA